MRHAVIAKNYAEALLAAAEAKDQAERFGELLDAVAGAVRADERIALVLESPRVAKPVKARILAEALQGAAPPELIRFLQAVVRRGRQGILGEIAQAYAGLVDLKLNRVHAGITLPHEPDGALQRLITERLGKALGKEVRALFRTEPAILGGVVVRVGDRIFDGSVRRRMNALRRRMLGGE